MGVLWKSNVSVLSRLKTIGEALHAGQDALVFDQGLVGLNGADESEVISNVAQARASGPSARSRPGRRTSSRSWRTAGTAKSFCSSSIEQAYGAGFRLLAQHYEALGFEDQHGLWVVIKTRPLGFDGPQAFLLVAAPTDHAISPRAWAFEKTGFGTRLFPHKHTNFPDASLCAFTKASQAWTSADGLLSLIDHYSLWVAKSLHRSQFGWWPGAQVGACAFYRRREFVARELCGCESGKTYSECHQATDLLVPEGVARQEFRRLFLCDYEERAPPVPIIEAASSGWKKLPSMAAIFSYRRSLDEPTIT